MEVEVHELKCNSEKRRLEEALHNREIGKGGWVVHATIVTPEPNGTKLRLDFGCRPLGDKDKCDQMFLGSGKNGWHGPLEEAYDSKGNFKEEILTQVQENIDTFTQSFGEI